MRGNTALKYSCEFPCDVAQCEAAGNRAQLSEMADDHYLAPERNVLVPLEHKAFSALLLSFFAAGLCLKPIAAWSGLALLLFLRLTKVHSLRYCQLDARSAQLSQVLPSSQSRSAYEGSPGRIAPGNESAIAGQRDTHWRKDGDGGVGSGCGSECEWRETAAHAGLI